MSPRTSRHIFPFVRAKKGSSRPGRAVARLELHPVPRVCSRLPVRARQPRASWRRTQCCPLCGCVSTRAGLRLRYKSHSNVSWEKRGQRATPRGSGRPAPLPPRPASFSRTRGTQRRLWLLLWGQGENPSQSYACKPSPKDTSLEQSKKGHLQVEVVAGGREHG